MVPFLKLVAQAYVEREAESLKDFCFVFPNKRSLIFFRHYLTHLAQAQVKKTGTPILSPELMTVGDFAASFTNLAEANRLEQIMLLYRVYAEILEKNHEEAPEFDKFYYWGDVLINDFNDVDRYLADPEQIFANVKNLKEISSSYLTREQVEIIKKYWGEDRLPGDEAIRFWNHMRGDKKLEGKFMQLWTILHPLYLTFNDRLKEKGLATNGMVLRHAVNEIKEKEKLPFDRYVFVGFNVLTHAEFKIFETLQKRGKADFYWDMNSPAMDGAGNQASRFLKNNIKCFPSRYDLDEEKITTFPVINIEGIPSTMGMAKRVGEILGKWLTENKIKKGGEAISTAIVLPDPSILLQTIHSIPPEIDNLNVTMGFPLRLTPVAVMISKILAMRMSKVKKDGKWCYRYDILKELLNNPFLTRIYGASCQKLLKIIKTNRQFYIDEELLGQVEELYYIFAPPSDEEFKYSIFTFLTRLGNEILKALYDHTSGSAETLMAEGFLKAVQDIKRAFDLWQIIASEATIYQMVRRAIRGESVPFNGEPLKGLQMLGVLETRALDFENIIMLSMNEATFPKKIYKASFIPDNLRRAYGLATTEFQESVYAYYFYRLISRAKNVTILYDTRDEGVKNGEPSRYITQLLSLYPEAKAQASILAYRQPTPTVRELKMPKEDWVKEILELYSHDPENKKIKAKFLSASAINTYIGCPMKFFFRYIAGLGEEDEITDYIDFSTYGTIVHAVAKKVYDKFKTGDKPVEITTKMLSDFYTHRFKWDYLITEEINETYNGITDPTKKRRELKGETEIMSDIIRGVISNLINIDKDKAPFTYIEGEKEVKTHFVLSDGRKINFKMIIDRVESDKKGLLSLIDYKTGKDTTDGLCVDAIFGHDNERKGIRQVLLYCNMYASKYGITDAVQPWIYQLGNLYKEGIKPITIGSRDSKDELTDYRNLNPEFMDKMTLVVDEIFNPEIPFIQCKDSKYCKYCQYNKICGRHTS